MAHKQITRLLYDKKYIKSSWWCQMVTVGYEYEKGKRVIGQTYEKGNVVSAKYYGMSDSFPMETTITITFEEHFDKLSASKKTKMTLYYPSTKGIEGKMLDDMTQGWNQSFDKLQSRVESRDSGL